MPFPEFSRLHVVTGKIWDALYIFTSRYQFVTNRILFMDATNTRTKESASCPMDFILRMLMGPWTTYILYNLKTHGPQRFGELKRRVAGISAKMLTERLRTLEGAALVRRDYEATIPPKVTYSLTRRGHELDEVMGKLAEIGTRWEAEDAAARSSRSAELKAAE